MNLNQLQVDQIVTALWGIAHAFTYIAEAIITAAVIRAFFNK